MDPVEIEIRALGNACEGIGTLPDGKKIFVDSPVITGEICSVEITQEKNKYSRGKCLEILRPSPDRVIPYGEEIPGANLAHISYEKQLEYKQDKVHGCLVRLGGFSDMDVAQIMRPIVPSPKTEHYRNHMQYSIKDGRFCLKSQGTNDDIPVDDSPLEYEMFGRCRALITSALSDYPNRLIDGVVLRGSERTGEMLVELVSFADTSSELIIRDVKSFIDATHLVENLNASGIMLRISNTATEKRTRGGKRVVLYGSDHYSEILCDRSFKVKAGAFFQVNLPQAEVLYRLATPSSYKGALWDLYCGTGTVGLSLVTEGHKLIGADISPEAIASAKENALRLGTDADFICKPASKITSLLSKITHDDAVVVDPPRAGLEFSLIRSLLAQKPSEISYISCDPATLARDLKLLTESGDYFVNSVTPVDMFPQTGHVETVVLLSKLSSAP